MNRAGAMSIFACALTMQACTTAYVQPQGANVAVLIIKSTSDVPVEVKAYKNAADCSGGTLFLTPDGRMPAVDELAINVKPDEAFSFFVSYAFVSQAATGDSMITYCNLPGTFTPRANGRYTAYFSVNAWERTCSMPMMVQTMSGEEPEPSFRLREWRAPFAGSGSFCK
jgi:hypothetical protein